MRLQLLNTSANTTKVRRKIFLHPEFLSLKRMNFHSSMRVDAISEKFFLRLFCKKLPSDLYFRKWDITMKNFMAAVLATAAFFSSATAQAQGSYLKLGIGESKYENSLVEKNDLATSIAYGFSFDKSLGLELGYVNFGTLKELTSVSSHSVQREAFYLAGVKSLPLTNELSVVGKLGLAFNRYEEKFSIPFFDGAESTTKTRPMVGVGAQYALNNQMSGVLEYQYFGKLNDVKASALTLGLTYGF